MTPGVLIKQKNANNWINITLDCAMDELEIEEPNN